MPPAVAPVRSRHAIGGRRVRDLSGRKCVNCIGKLSSTIKVSSQCASLLMAWREPFAMASTHRSRPATALARRLQKSHCQDATWAGHFRRGGLQAHRIRWRADIMLT